MTHNVCISYQRESCCTRLNVRPVKTKFYYIIELLSCPPGERNKTGRSHPPQLPSQTEENSPNLAGLHTQSLSPEQTMGQHNSSCSVSQSSCCPCPCPPCLSQWRRRRRRREKFCKILIFFQWILKTGDCSTLSKQSRVYFVAEFQMMVEIHWLADTKAFLYHSKLILCLYFYSRKQLNNLSTSAIFFIQNFLPQISGHVFFSDLYNLKFANLFMLQARNLFSPNTLNLSDSMSISEMLQIT